MPAWALAPVLGAGWKGCSGPVLAVASEAAVCCITSGWASSPRLGTWVGIGLAVAALAAMALPGSRVKSASAIRSGVT